MNVKNKLYIIVIILFAHFYASAQCTTTPNIGFESGYNNWTYWMGTNAGTAPTVPPIPWGGPIPVGSLPILGGIEIMSGAGTDFFGPPINVVCPLTTPNTQSLKLGSTNVMGQSERVQYSVTVPTGQPYIVLNYYFAVVLENPKTPTGAPAHDPLEMPYFQARVLDASGAVVACSQYTYNAAALPGSFTLSANPSPTTGAFDVYYQNWRAASLVIPASASPATVEFITADCSGTIHFGYAYVDMDCSTFSGDMHPCYPGMFTLHAAPPGYSTYNWYQLPSWTPLGSVSALGTLPAFPVPSTATDYALVMTPIPGFGCAETLHVHVDPIETPVVGTIDPIVLCVGDSLAPSFTGYTTVGGTWTIGTPSVAGFTSTGKIKGLSAGTSLITYTVSHPPCGTATAVGVVSVNPLPTLISFAEITGNHCEGDMLTFIVNTDAGTPPKEISYNYILGGVPSIYYMVSADAAGHFSITLPATGPTTSFHLDGIYDPATGCWRIVDEWIHVCVDPHPTTGILWGPSTLCQGEVASYHVGATGIGSGTTGWTYTSTSGPSSVTFNVIGLHSTTLTAGDPGTGVITFDMSNCCGQASVSAPITILPQPNVYSMSYIGCNIPCPGTPLTFKFTGTPGATVYWKWEDPTTPGIYTTGLPVTLSTGGATGVGFATIPGGALGEGMVTIFITNIMGANGCPNPIGPVGSVTVEWPKANFGQIPPSGICAGDCINYIAVYGPPGGTVYYSATPGPAFTPPISLDAGGYGTMPMLCPTVTTTYQITGVVGPCCTHMYAGPSFTISVLPNPVVGLTSNSPICEGNPLILTATCPTCNQPYSWAGPASGLPTTTPPAITSHYTVPSATPSNSGIYTVTGAITYPPGDVTCTANATTSVVVDAKPYVTMRCRGYLCQYSSSVITLTFTGSPNATVTYVSNPTGLGGSVTLNGVGSATVIIPVTSPTSSYDFYVTGIVSATGACIITDTLAVCNIMYLLRPSCPVTYNSSTGLITITGWGPGMSLTINCFDGTSWIPVVFTYTGSSSTFSPSILPPGTISIEITGFYDGFCEWIYGGDMCYAYIPSTSPRPGLDGSGNNPLQQQSLSIIPNPNKGTFTIVGNLPDMIYNETVKVEVVDVLGKTIVTEDATVENGYINKRIVISEVLPGGTYIVKIKNEKTSSTLRFTIER